jgi:hypothetical protein
MATDPDKTLARRGGEVVHVPRGGDGFPLGFFCASPTILEAINHMMQGRGMATLWVQMDGTIGPTDPLLMRVEYVPSPFLY